MNLNDLKRKHNELLEIGSKQYAQMLETYEQTTALQRQIEAIEGDDYDPIPLIFGDGFYIHEEDESKEVVDQHQNTVDAERYRWWRNTMLWEPRKVAVTIAPCASIDAVDAAIDAAREAK